jgi:hypothetical protein
LILINICFQETTCSSSEDSFLQSDLSVFANPLLSPQMQDNADNSATDTFALKELLKETLETLEQSQLKNLDQETEMDKKSYEIRQLNVKVA